MLAIDPPLCAPAVVAATRLFAATGRDPSMHPPPLGESTRALAADPRPRTPAVVVATRKFADTGRDLCAPAALAADPQPLGAPTCAHHGSTHTRRALRRSTTMRPRRLNSHTLVCGHTHVPDAAGRVPHARTTTIAMDLPPGGGGGGAHACSSQIHPHTRSPPCALVVDPPPRAPAVVATTCWFAAARTERVPAATGRVPRAHRRSTTPCLVVVAVTW